jgi:hypothetical protein
MSIIAIACQVAYYLIMAYGVYVCWRAYASSKKKAWLLVGIFCLSAFIGLGMQQLSKAMYRNARSQPQQEQIMGEDGQLIPAKTTAISLPIFPLLLVAGLSLLAEDEIKGNRKAQLAGAQDGESVGAPSPPVT